jgi:penicillin-binding protein 2
VWDIDGKPVRTVADLPPQENVPIEGVPTGPRNVGWRPDVPATLVWTEALDGGNPAKKASRRDRVLSLAAPFSDKPIDLAKTEHRFQSLIWGEKGILFIRNGKLEVCGEDGKRYVEVNALGRRSEAFNRREPVPTRPGRDLELTLDANVQRATESALDAAGYEGPEPAPEIRGAAILMDVWTGEILAMASRPGFDPNILSRELTPKQWADIVQDEGRPLNNRASQGQYPPGSIFKVMMAAAALETKTVTPSTSIFCNGGYQFGRRVYHDWKAGGHGSVDLRHALVHSCDVYFYTVGQRMGIETMASFAHQFGLGEETGIDLPSERVGIVPSEAWKRKAKNEAWLPGETISASIGQGYVNVTPLQMATLIGTVANDGVMFRPRLVQAVMDRATGELQQRSAVPKRTLKLRPGILPMIKEALAGVVKEGTGTRAQSALVTIAGKTGTAQTLALRTGPEKDIPKKFRDHAWFVAFAPVDAPTIAVAVLGEHMGHGGSASAPLAKELIETYVKLNLSVPPGAKDGAVVRVGDAGGQGTR